MTTSERVRPLPVRSVGVTLADTDDGEVVLPAVLVDASDRPDVADLARVHAVEGVGDVATSATIPAPGVVRLTVALTRPVRCRFEVELAGVEQRAFLADAGAAGCFVLATGDPSGPANQHWLAVDLDGDQVVAVAAQADRADGVRHLDLTADGVASLRTILGILADHDLPPDARRAVALDARLAALEADAAGGADDAAPVPRLALDLADALLLLDGMELTEAASVGLPWFDQVVWTGQFVHDQLRPLWADEAWRAAGRP